MDLLTELVDHLQPRCRSPLVHTFETPCAVQLGTTGPALHLVWRGNVALRTPADRHSRLLGEGTALLLSGAELGVLHTIGHPPESATPLDWSQGRTLARSQPDLPGTLQLVSSRVDVAVRAKRFQPLPSLVLLEAGRIPVPRSYPPLLDALLEELSFARLGREALTRRLLDSLLLQLLRTEVLHGSSARDAWLGALADPVLRTCLDDADALSTRAPVRSLASTSLRSPRRLSARVKAASGAGLRSLAQQLRIQRVLQLLEQGIHPLTRIAHQSGFSSVSALCRAFAREVGTSPGAYWRRIHQRPLPRRPPDRSDSA